MLHQGLLREFLLQGLLTGGLRFLLLLLLIHLRSKGKRTELRNVAGVQAEPEAAAESVNAAQALGAGEKVPDEPEAAAVLKEERAAEDAEPEPEPEHAPVVSAAQPHVAQISSSCSKTCPRWKRTRSVAGPYDRGVEKFMRAEKLCRGYLVQMGWE